MRLTDDVVESVSLLLLAPIIGSFLGVVVRRLPEGSGFLWSRSHCEACGTALGARDLVPFVSWAVAGGRCRHCAAPLGWFYPGIELAALIVAVVALWVHGMPGAWLDCLFGWWLLALAWIDLRRWLLPDALTLPLIVAGLVAAMLLDPSGLFDRALGAALGYLGLALLAAAYRSLRGRAGLGEGDPKLLAAAGAWVGATALPQVVLLAALAGLIVAGLLRLAGMRMRATTALPFGPPLALATWVIWLLGPVTLL